MIGNLLPADERAFRERLVILIPRLRSLARGLTGSRGDADDLVQATCERAIKRWRQWSGEGRLEGWLFRMMRNLWHDGLRARKADRLDANTPSDELIGQNGASTQIGSVELDEVRREIARLPVDQQMALMLVCVEGFTYEEAAGLLDIPVGTVRSRLSRARQALIERFDRTD